MKICRFHHFGKGPTLGYVHQGRVYDLTAAAPDRFASIVSLLSNPHAADEIKSLHKNILTRESFAFDELDRPPSPEAPHLLAPIDQQEVWAAGVTYLRSQAARIEESEAAADHYDRVYEAARPEIFFKATPHRTAGPNTPVRIRADSGDRL